MREANAISRSMKNTVTLSSSNSGAARLSPWIRILPSAASLCRSHKPRCDSIVGSAVWRRMRLSSFSKRASIDEAIGLNTVTATTPTTSATSTAGIRNCQTETPAARATTSSLLRVNRQNASIVPNRIANGMTSCAVCGILSAAISSRIPQLAWARPPPRRSSSR